MRLDAQCLNTYKGPKFSDPLPQPGWLDRVKNYPDIDKKRIGPCQSRQSSSKNSQ